MEAIRYAVAACQTDMPNPIERRQMRSNTDRMLAMIDAAVAGSAPFLPVRLVVFPEFAHAAPVFPTVHTRYTAVRTICPVTTNRFSRSPTRRLVESAARSAMTGCFRKRSASWR